jgi:S1-C subfamily serine protease
MHSNGGPRGVLRRGVLVAVLAASVGVLVGHILWSAANAVRLSPAASGSFGPFRYAGPGGAAGSPSEGAGAGAAHGSAAGVSSSITTKVDPALVDIDTDLGLEGGEGAGTGMVVTSTGEVFTNNHVITGATKIVATDVGNGTTYTARVVGYDYGRDVAVLQLEGASGLKTASFGSSSSLKTGLSVATIGNAGGAGGTPSAATGQVSALDQTISASDEVYGSPEHLSGMIQLNADLQPGDSGGPLVNSSGEVLGMDTAASETFHFQSSANEGFAIPIEEVQAIAGQINEGHGSGTTHIGSTGMLGVLVQSRSSEGALIENVLSGSPAAGSGLTAGDVITAVDGTGVSSPTALTGLILRAHPGDGVRITWRTRAGEQHTATITLAEGPPE